MTGLVTINLFNYREELKRISVQKQVLQSLGIIGLFLVLCVASFLVQQIRISVVEQEIVGLEDEIKGLQNTVNEVNEMKKKKDRLDGIITEIHNIRHTGVPMQRMLEDIFRTVPEGMWLTRIEQLTWREANDQRRIPLIFFGDPSSVDKDLKVMQKDRKEDYDIREPFVEIVGKSYSEASMAAFIQGLSRLPYFTQVIPLKKEGMQFYVYCLTDNPAKLFGGKKAEAPAPAAKPPSS